MSSERERWIQDDLYRMLFGVTRDKRFAGLTFSVRTEFPVRGRSADIAVLRKPDDVPILVIETKRKVERRGHYRKESRFDPYGRAVIGQALSYAALIKEEFNLPVTPAFATANRDVIVLFSPVRDPWKYLNRGAVENGDYEQALEPSAYVSLIHEYYLFDAKNPLREELLQHVLDQVSRIWQRIVLPEEVRRPIGDWLIGRLRYFVDSLSFYYVEDVLRKRLMEDEDFAANLNALAVEAGYKNGLADIVGSDYSRVLTLARMMSYALMNKIIFYKVLERSYKVPELKPLLEENPEISSEEYLKTLDEFFGRAIEVTGDFEQIFHTGLFDYIIISDEREALAEIDELIRLLSTIEIERLGDIIGPIYENLIPAEERHQMGQFYTPQPIAELIAKWCIRKPSDIVLGPGCGSGTFEIEAYWRLAELKTGRKRGIPPGRSTHRSILKQIYALDINPFPAQLTAMNLAMKNVRAPTTDANIISADFFSIIPGQTFIAPYPVMTPSGPKHKEITFPEKGFDVIMGNPPYTRWTEIPEAVQDRIRERLGDVLTRYGLHADVTRGKEPGIYIHFIIWAHKFLRAGGRLGMIISDSWLQTDYGVNFGRYLLENFKVKAIIDISARVFPVPLIGTCIILLEKPNEGESIDDNRVAFIYLNIPEGRSFDVDDILKAVWKPEETQTKYLVKIYRQGDLPRDKKWINFLFNSEEILSTLSSSDIILPASEFFEISRGNYLYSLWALKNGKRPDIGAKDFFYLNQSKVDEWGLKDFVHPAITSSRHCIHFSFTEEDWTLLKERGSDCYFFMCSVEREKLPDNVKNYIRWGETECRTLIRGTRGGGKVCSQALACQERAKHPEYFKGWYDLGGLENAPILAVYQSQYKTRFILNEINAVTYHAMIAFIPKKRLSKLKLKALLAYLNSSFTQLYIESVARITGMGVAALEVKHAKDMPILDITKLDDKSLEEFAELFDKLDSESRRIGGAHKRENIEYLWDTIISKIDEKISEIAGVSPILGDAAKILARSMMERRLSRAEEARPEALKGSERRLSPHKQRRRRTRVRGSSGETRLTDFA